MDTLIYPYAPGLIGVVSLLWLLYRYLLPRPIPGIPYNKEAARRILGDAPDIMAYVKEHAEPYRWGTMQCVKHQSPIVQIFDRPFARPSVYVTDFREAYDVVTRRTKEFDRSWSISDMFSGVLPHNQVTMPTNDRWKANRRLVADTMSPGFLNNVTRSANSSPPGGLLSSRSPQCACTSRQ